MIRVMYLGQKPIGEKCFELLLNQPDNSLKIFTTVSNARTDNVWWKTNEIYKKCMDMKIDFISNESKNKEAVLSAINEFSINTLISVQHSWILDEDVLKAVNYNAFNLHLARLPDYKGFYSYNHAILNGEKTYGISLHWMDDKVDEGSIAFEQAFDITPDDTAYSLYKKSCEHGYSAFNDLITCFISEKEIPKYTKSGKGHFYSKNSLAGLNKINNITDAEEVDKKARAFYFPPFEYANFNLNGKTYYVLP